MTTAYLISHDQVITLFHEGQTYTISTAHANHGPIMEVLAAEEYDKLVGLLGVPDAIRKIDGRITVENDRVFFNEPGQDPLEVEGPVADRLISFMSEKLPFRPLMRFIENLMANPSRRSVQELYGFLENQGMPITEDGCFLGYKGINGDWMDKYSGTVRNMPGDAPSMPRNKVDDDANRGCSHGFHVGSQRYASDWASPDGRLVLVKVNPKDAVSVPHESCEKIRVTDYEVVQEIPRDAILQSTLVDQDEMNSLNVADDEDNRNPCIDCLDNDCDGC